MARETKDDGWRPRRDFTMRTAFIVDPIASNSMKSDNPCSGFHETERAVTLDTSTQNPTRNGGGMLIVEARGWK